jgi:hypothetical protein
MKKVYFILLFMFPAYAWAQPSIEFTTEKYDFGNVVQGAMLEYSFEFRNVGTDELIVKEVNTS